MGNWLEQNKNIVFLTLIFITILVGVLIYLPASAPEMELALVEPSPTPTATATSTMTPTPTPSITPTPSATPNPKPLRVYISGAVHQPDVYFVSSGSIIEDVLILAGGATDEADLEVINLALEVKDQQQINIPTQDQNLPTPPVVSGGVDPTATPQPTINFSPSSAAESQSATTAPAAKVKINLNTADAEALMVLKGIGPVTAQKIIDYRQANGGFRSIEEVMEVKGIGPATFEKMKDQITVE